MGIMSQYYQTPMGEDTHKKLWLTIKYSGATGLVASTIDVLLLSYPKGYLETLGRFVYVTGPFIGIASAFTIGANISASIRKKDDFFNYAVGSIACGSMIGCWRRKMIVGFVSSIFLMMGSLVVKTGLDEGWNFNKVPRPAINTINTKWYDYTLTPEGERGWTTGKK